jgi:hypothetical protein
MAAISDITNKIHEGWETIRQKAITKIENFLNTGNPQFTFTKKEYSDYYT